MSAYYHLATLFTRSQYNRARLVMDKEVDPEALFHGIL